MSNRPGPIRRLAVGAVALATVALGLGLTAGTAGATGTVSYTTQSLTDTNRDCGGSPISPATKSLGSVLMVQSPPFFGFPASLFAGVYVQHATPNSTYDVRIIQEGASGLVGSCSTVVGKVVTDAYGNGGTIASTPLLAGATKWWVDLNNRANFADFMDTGLATVAS